jgi:hypothetical protein
MSLLIISRSGGDLMFPSQSGLDGLLHGVVRHCQHADVSIKVIILSV